MENSFRNLKNIVPTATLAAALFLLSSPYALGSPGDSFRLISYNTVEPLFSNGLVIPLSISEMNVDRRLHEQRQTIMLAAASDEEDEDEAKEGEEGEKEEGGDAPEPRCWDHPCLG